jgi:hypothetical protein
LPECGWRNDTAASWPCKAPLRRATPLR